MMRINRLLSVALLFIAHVAPAAACPSLAGELDERATAARVQKLEARLDVERRRLTLYRRGWPVIFGVAAISQVAVAELGSDKRRPAFLVSAFKATLGATVTPFLSPRAKETPRLAGEAPCSRLRRLEDAWLDLGRRERRGGAWYNHALGVALNVAGLLYLGLVEDQWIEGLAGALVGSAVGELRLWTQPRGAAASSARLGLENGALTLRF